MFKCGFYPLLNFTIFFRRNISLLCYDKNSLRLVLNLKPKPVFEKEYKRQPIRCRVQPIRCRGQLSLLVELVYDYKRCKIYESSLKREYL